MCEVSPTQHLYECIFDALASVEPIQNMPLRKDLSCAKARQIQSALQGDEKMRHLLISQYASMGLSSVKDGWNDILSTLLEAQNTDHELCLKMNVEPVLLDQLPANDDDQLSPFDMLWVRESPIRDIPHLIYGGDDSFHLYKSWPMQHGSFTLLLYVKKSFGQKLSLRYPHSSAFKMCKVINC